MKILIISTNPKKAEHLIYSDIVQTLFFLIAIKGKRKYKITKKNNVYICFVYYRFFLNKYFVLFKMGKHLIKNLLEH